LNAEKYLKQINPSIASSFLFTVFQGLMAVKGSFFRQLGNSIYIEINILETFHGTQISLIGFFWL